MNPMKMYEQLQQGRRLELVFEVIISVPDNDSCASMEVFEQFNRQVMDFVNASENRFADTDKLTHLFEYFNWRLAKGGNKKSGSYQRINDGYLMRAFFTLLGLIRLAKSFANPISQDYFLMIRE